MKIESSVTHQFFRRVLAIAGGRPFAGVLLVLSVVMTFLGEYRVQNTPQQTWLASASHAAGEPGRALRDWTFQTYQRVQPRVRQSQPVTIVAIDEKSLSEVGQWPWPRYKLAELIRELNVAGAATVGLDMYLPEPDQASPARVALGLGAEYRAIAESLKSLPSNDSRLAWALRQTPSVLGVAGFDVKEASTSDQMRSAPVLTQGADPRRFVRHYPYVLASLPELQAAAWGQALLSVDAARDAVMEVPMVAAVGPQLVAGLAVEMFRVATDSPAIKVRTGSRGIETLVVADLEIPTQADGSIWVHAARLEAGLGRYLSASDVLKGEYNPEALAGKLVLVGLTGQGLNDMRRSALGEVVPGIEIQAQVVESLFDRHFLVRPWWMQWVELAALAVGGLLLLWYLPKTNSRFAGWIHARPVTAFALTLLIDVVVLGLGFYLFHSSALLFNGAALTLGFSLVAFALISGSLIEGMGSARTKLARLVDNGISLGRERDQAKLLGQTLEYAREMTQCRAALMFLKTSPDTLAYAMGTDEQIRPPEGWSLDLRPSVSQREVLAHVAKTGTVLVIDDLDGESVYNTALLTECTQRANVQAMSALGVPLQSADGRTIGVLQLLNAMDPQTGRAIAFDAKIIGFIEALAAQAAAAIENHRLLQAQTRLMDSMIKIIAGAIDTKSPYTGGHCERVPELAMMLAEKASAIKEGPLADFEFKSEDEWREFRIGAWLHDCGKVTTPEYVVDKATKLETIYNRIHEVRLRFEVLLRDARIEQLLDVQAGGEAAATANERFEAKKAQLMEDFAFLAECNLGGEFMAPEKIERVLQIAKKTWWRHFDDRLGLSHDELSRVQREPEQSLPAQEALLADRPRHLFDRPPDKAFDESYGFTLKPPTHLYNHGEIHNLSVGRGTLTDEERFKINEHIIQTIVMLEQLPLPDNLRRVPEYAGTHHETLNGSGYPRRLSAEQLSVPARIMAIADIFEALTASDRPYKKAKTLSECIQILHGFKKNQHIDGELFDLFLTSGVYQTYAEKYLNPEQIDAVEIEQYLSPA